MYLFTLIEIWMVLSGALFARGIAAVADEFIAVGKHPYYFFKYLSESYEFISMRMNTMKINKMRKIVLIIAKLQSTSQCIT